MLVLIIGVLIGVVVLITLILALLYIRWEKKNREHIESTNRKIVVNRSGADVNSGHLGSGSLFNGFGQQSLDTICISENSRHQVCSVRNKKIELIHVKTKRKYFIACSDKFFIGRNCNNKIVSNSIAINYPSISSLHCEIIYSNGKVYIEDKKSTNGTYVNGRRITYGQYLQNNDIVKLGNEEFKVVIVS